MNIKITPLMDTLHLQKINDEEYFSKSYSNYVSNSRLNLLDPEKDGSFERFVAGFKPNYAGCLEIGSGVHELTLQNDLFELVYQVDKPTAKMGVLADRLYPIYRENEIITEEEIIKESTIIDYYGGNLNDKKISNVRDKCEPYWKTRKQFEESYSGNKSLLFFDPRSRETVVNCVEALKNNRKVQKLLRPTDVFGNPLISETEQAILLDVMVEVGSHTFILKLKAKLDHYSIDVTGNEICTNDVKTIGRTVNECFDNIKRFGYNRELSIYSWLLSLCAKKYYNMEKPTVKANYLFVSTIPGHYTKVIPVTREMFKEGWNDFKRLLSILISNFEFYPESNIFVRQ